MRVVRLTGRNSLAAGTRLIVRAESWLEKIALKRRGFYNIYSSISRDFYCHDKYNVESVVVNGVTFIIDPKTNKMRRE